ncbi:dipeptidyl peptidase 3 [Trichonephila clavipes]|nr:dipeptidyl peptidase 3 [Trichonephila clavipes]
MERRYLHENVWPELQRHCASSGVDLEVLDVQLGNDLDSTYDPHAFEQQLMEIENCYQESLGCFLVAFYRMPNEKPAKYEMQKLAESLEEQSNLASEVDQGNIGFELLMGKPCMGEHRRGPIPRVGHSILECHCIIHQQALCAKSGLTSLDNTITLITKIVNLISSQALNKLKLDALLDEVNSVNSGLLMYNNVRWLSRGNVLQRFVDCLEEIRLFLQEESKIEQYP